LVFFGKVLCEAKGTLRSRNNGQLEKRIGIFYEPRDNSMSALVVCHSFSSFWGDQL
jgi:hypothetical protein